MKRHLWIESAALFKSEYYQGHATLIQAAKMYPEFTIQSKSNPNDEMLQYVPVISERRIDPYTPYQGDTEWDDAANILLDKLNIERKNNG